MTATLAPTRTAAPSAFEAARDREAQRRLDRETRTLGELAHAEKGEEWQTFLVRRCYLMAEACGQHPLTGRPYYRPADFLAEVERAVTEYGCAVPKIGPATVMKLARHELVPNMRIRARFEHLAEEEGLTSSTLAVAIGESRPAKLADGEMVERGDSTRVERMLGLTHLSAHGGVKWLRLFVTYEQAIALADALGIDYHDLGV